MLVTCTIIILVGLYFLAALFCCIEACFTSVNLTWLRDQADQENERAVLALRLLEKSGSFFGTVLLGTNLVHVSISTLVSAVLVTAFLKTELAARLSLTQDMKSVVATLIATPTLLLFSELLPKAIGRSHADSLVLALAGTLDALRVILAWPVRIIAWISGLLSKPFLKKTEEKHGGVSRDDLMLLANIAEEQGLIRKEAGQFMTSILELDNEPVESVMVPLVDMKTLSITATVADVVELASQTGFTRFPVYESRVDEIIGIISLRRCIFEKHQTVGQSKLMQKPIAPMVDRNISFVPESKTVGALLNEFRSSHSPMMLVVDEYGGVAGIVTIEDLIGLLIGGIEDLRNQAASSIVKTSEGVYECDGKAEIRELEETLDIDIDNDGYETVAGLFLKISGRIPAVGDTVSFMNYELRVLEVEKRRIAKILLTDTTVAKANK